MAAVAVCIVAVTFPLVMLQRWLLKNGRQVRRRSRARRGAPAAAAARQMEVGRARRSSCAWLFVTVIVPISGIALRAFVTQLGRRRERSPTCSRSTTSATVFDAADAGARHHEHGADRRGRRRARGRVLHGDRPGRRTASTTAGRASLDYLVLVPRAVPGLLAGLAFLWVFLFFPPLAPLRSTIFSVWLAYSVVWLAYGMRLDLDRRCCRSARSSRRRRAASARARGRVTPRRHAAADPLRPARRVAAGVHDLRARVLDRRLPARRPAPR